MQRQHSVAVVCLWEWPPTANARCGERLAVTILSREVALRLSIDRSTLEIRYDAHFRDCRSEMPSVDPVASVQDLLGDCEMDVLGIRRAQ
jgi:hypothetical protein